MKEDFAELKQTLERIEGKLISAGKIYSAMQFQIWLVVMLFYYLILSHFSSLPWQLSLFYWILAFAVFSYASARIFRRMANLYKAYGQNMKSRPSFGIGMALSWTSGALIGWILVPSILAGIGMEEISAIGFLSFISISVFGMFVTFLYVAKSFEKEMIPAFLIPVLAIASIGNVTAESMVYAGFAVGSGFSLTVLAYLYTAFKSIR